jgi:PilZ domain
MNRRTNQRESVQLNCRLIGPGKNSKKIQGKTVNISRHGLLTVLVEPTTPTLDLLQPGRMWTVEVQLPSDHPFEPKCMHCQATVTRVTAGTSGDVRVAFKINYMKFQNFAGTGLAEFAADLSLMHQPN